MPATYDPGGYFGFIVHYADGWTQTVKIYARDEEEARSGRLAKIISEESARGTARTIFVGSCPFDQRENEKLSAKLDAKAESLTKKEGWF